jgi:transposase
MHLKQKEFEELAWMLDKDPGTWTQDNVKKMQTIRHDLAKLNKTKFDESLKRNGLVQLKYIPGRGMPEFKDGRFPGLFMQESPCKVNVEGMKKVVAVDVGCNPLAACQILGGVVVYAGLGLNGYLRNGDRKMAKLQTKRDNRGNLLQKKDFEKLGKVLNDVTIPAKEKDKAQSVYNLGREKEMQRDAICKSWKRQFESIKRAKEKACSVAREELATFLSLFDVVVIGDNDYRKWMQGLSHAASSVLSALSPGKLVEKIKFKLGVTGGQLVKVCEAWSSKLCSCCGALNDPGNSDTYTCSSCGIKMNRDENGARSILILALCRVYSILGDITMPRNSVMEGASDVVH